mmetsp:Transcript_9522/g.16371  ORF Transcript_9522/g.16371 Transcript_9522/m.16371 type:complete len:216 (+) Transcript_9522:60-707(+)
MGKRHKEMASQYGNTCCSTAGSTAERGAPPAVVAGHGPSLDLRRRSKEHLPAEWCGGRDVGRHFRSRWSAHGSWHPQQASFHRAASYGGYSQRNRGHAGAALRPAEVRLRPAPATLRRRGGLLPGLQRRPGWLARCAGGPVRSKRCGDLRSRRVREVGTLGAGGIDTLDRQVEAADRTSDDRQEGKVGPGGLRVHHQHHAWRCIQGPRGGTFGLL